MIEMKRRDREGKISFVREGGGGTSSISETHKA